MFSHLSIFLFPSTSRSHREGINLIVLCFAPHRAVMRCATPCEGACFFFIAHGGIDGAPWYSGGWQMGLMTQNRESSCLPGNQIPPRKKKRGKKRHFRETHRGRKGKLWWGFGGGGSVEITALHLKMCFFLLFFSLGHSATLLARGCTFSIHLPRFSRTLTIPEFIRCGEQPPNKDVQPTNQTAKSRPHTFNYVLQWS